MKPLVHGEVCDEHTTHQVWPRPGGQCLDAVVPVPRKVKIPQRLRSRFLPDELRASLVVPILAPGAPGTDLRLDFDGVVVLLAHTADNSSVPLVAVPPLRETAVLPSKSTFSGLRMASPRKYASTTNCRTTLLALPRDISVSTR